MLEESDPDAAKQLMAQAAMVKEKLRGTSDLREPYDPSALQARVLRGYKGGVTVRDLDTMSYRRFFGLVRELEIMLEDEKRASNSNKGNSTDAQAAMSDMQQPEEYTGETIRLI